MLRFSTDKYMRNLSMAAECLAQYLALADEEQGEQSFQSIHISTTLETFLQLS